MKHNNFSRNQNQTPAGETTTTPTADSNQREINFVPSPDEIAKRAYFCYVNQGWQAGHESQHWLEAEAQLFAEHKRDRVHRSHN